MESSFDFSVQHNGDYSGEKCFFIPQLGGNIIYFHFYIFFAGFFGVSPIYRSKIEGNVPDIYLAVFYCKWSKTP